LPDWDAPGIARSLAGRTLTVWYNQNAFRRAMMEINNEELQGLIKQAVMEALQKREAEKKDAELEAKTPHELNLENVLKFSCALQESVYTRDALRNILAETIGDLEAWDYGKRRINEDILGRFLSAIDREAKTPTTKEVWQERRAEKEAEYEKQRAMEGSITY
jgi:hypothetical protein